MTKRLRRISINVGVLVLLVPIGASIFTAVAIPDYYMFVPAGILAVAAIIWNRRSNKTRKEEQS